MAGEGVGAWSTTPGNNNDASIGGWPEGMPPSDVNDRARENLASIREWYNTAEWIEYGDGDGQYSVSYSSATDFIISGANVASVAQFGRRVKATGTNTGTIYGTISNSVFSAGNTTVTVTWDSGTLASDTDLRIFYGIIGANLSNAMPRTLKGRYTFSDTVIFSQQIPVTSGGTGASTTASIITALGIGALGVHNIGLGLESLSGSLVQVLVDTGTMQLVTAGVGVKNGGINSAQLNSSIEAKIALAWINFNGDGAASIRDSNNVSSVDYNGTGDYGVRFANAAGNANYAAVITPGGGANNGLVFEMSTITAGGFNFQVYSDVAGTAADATIVSAICFGG